MSAQQLSMWCHGSIYTCVQEMVTMWCKGGLHVMHMQGQCTKTMHDLSVANHLMKRVVVKIHAPSVTAAP